MSKQKEYKNHAEVPSKYKWDLSFLLEGKTIEERIDELVKLIEGTIAKKDSKYASKEAYLAHFKEDEEISLKYFKVHNYLSNASSLNTVDPKITGLQQQISFEMYKINQKMGPEKPRFNKHVKEIKEWIKDGSFGEHTKDIQASIDSQKHDLSPEIQEFRVLESRADVSASEVFSLITNAELDFGVATDKDGNETKITNGNRSVLMKSLDSNIRKSTSDNYIGGYMKHKASLSNLLYQHFKTTTVWAKLEKFDTTIDSLVYGDRVDRKFLTTLYKATEDTMPLFKKAKKWHGKFYEAKFGKKITKYDHSVDLVDVKSKYTPEEAIEVVIKSVEPFGKEYSDKVKDALLKENWVDFMPVKNKRSGAYSIGASYGIDKKLIEMNFDGTLRSVETLAHEMGHSMHSYFSDTRNGLTGSQYPIFVAEIASIFNELMLADHLLEESKNDELKFYILQSLVEGFQGTVLRQVAWSNYEFDLYNAIEKGEPLSSHDALSKFYYESVKKYSTKEKLEKYNPEKSFECFMVPHYYYGFYVYKYAIGQLVANIFFQKYKQEGASALQDFINKFLSAGGTKWPLEVLKDAGVDLKDPKVYELGFKAFDDILSQWITVGKKIFDVK